MKVTLIGGGGFRAPIVFESMVAIAPAVGLEELVLHDVDAGRLERIAAVCEGLDRQRGGAGVRVRTTTDLQSAADGASFVFAAVRPGGLAARVVDEAVPLEHGVLGQETVGPGGICFALRTVPVMLEVAGVIAERSPRAWLVNFTNPAGLVTEAVREILADRAVGICDAPSALCGHVAAALRRPLRSLRFGYAGLNHLGWLMDARDGSGDLLAALIADDEALETIEEARLVGRGRVRERGLLPNEYLVYLERTEEIVRAFRERGSRAATLREQQGAFYAGLVGPPQDAVGRWRAALAARHGSYLAEARSTPTPSGTVAAATVDDEGPGEAGYAAIAASFVLAVAGGEPAELVLDVANRGRPVRTLDERAVVEVPCRVDAGGPAPLPVPALPSEEAGLVERVKDVERLTIRAATTGSLADTREAIAAHPVVPSREVADRIVDGYLANHRWMRERFG